MITSKLKEIMLNEGISIRTLALRSNLSIQTIHRARSASIAECRLCTLRCIAEALQRPISSLFEEKTPEQRSASIRS